VGRPRNPLGIRIAPRFRVGPPRIGDLATITERYAIHTIADIPCGDFNWIGTHLDAWPRLEYVGFDIVAELIKRNQRVFPNRRFAKLDIVSNVPPRFDLLFSKDVINHLKNGEIVQAIANMRLSGSKYLLATNNFGYSNEELNHSFFLVSSLL
jgi:trans-aconitate methyltransferase